MTKATISKIRFQSTLLQEERLYQTIELKDFEISIHAPTRGATIVTTIIKHTQIYFNPRSYKRSD